MTQIGIVLTIVVTMLSLSAMAQTGRAIRYYVTPSNANNTQLLVSMEKPSDMNKVAATVDHQATMMSTGWDVINVTTMNIYSDEVQAFAAGYGEGYLTVTSTWDNFYNLYGFPNGTIVPDPSTPAVTAWLEANWNWTKTQVAAKKAESNYWHQVGLMVQQYDGFLAGMKAKGPGMSFVQLMFVVGVGDLYDIMPALNVEHGPWSARWKSSSHRDGGISRVHPFEKIPHCSALIKLKDDGSDIFFGHTTWSAYNNALRQYKHYNFAFNQTKGAASQQVSFSGYPGDLSSVDDFYVVDTGLVTIETSLAVVNQSLYNGTVVPESLLYWIRVSVANRMATSGKEWTEIFAHHNSGTYNNQWMVLDLNKFTPKKSLPNGTLYILEQIPGQVGVRDATEILSYGYWPSYNLPSIKEFYDLMGYPAAVKQYGPQMNDYEMCVRAQIFRRDQGTVSDMPSMMHMMQYNDYLHDNISAGNPWWAISSRGDLATPAQGGQGNGGVDSKVSSYTMFRSGRQVLARSGPTQQQPVFDFLTTNYSLGCEPRLGLPLVWNFEWQHFAPVVPDDW